MMTGKYAAVSDIVWRQSKITFNSADGSRISESVGRYVVFE